MMEERLYRLQTRVAEQESGRMPHWLLEDAMGVTDELHRFLLQRDQEPQQQQQPQQLSDSTSNYRSDGNRNNDGDTSHGGTDKGFQFSTSVMRWAFQLEFLQFCYSLKCNRPNIHSVAISSIHNEINESYPDGRLRYLGNAMLHNTHITELVVDVENMLDENNDIQRAAALIEFIRTSTALRKVGIRKAWISTPAETDRDNHLAALMLDAITTNALIQELDIKGLYPIDAFHNLMSTSTSLKALNIDCDNFNRIANNSHRNHLLHALARNQSIDHLSFTVSTDGWVWLEEIPLAMGSGMAKVRKLTLAHCDRLPPPFYKLIQTTSLQTLEMKCYWQSFSLEDQSMLQRALARNKGIENLKLIVRCAYDAEVIDNILLHLHNGPSTLRKLSLESTYNGNFNAMRQYLCHTTTQLRDLELEGCSIDEDGMTCLMEGLQEKNSNQSTVMTQLALKSCRLRKEALRRLVEFIAARSKYHNQQHPQVLRSLFLSKEPNLVSAMHSPPDVAERRNAHCVENVMLVSMLTTLLSSSSSGISSDHPGPTGCISLSMRPYGNLPVYCDSLMATVEAPSLVCLRLSHLRPADISKLALCLPRLMSLSALHLVNIQDAALPTQILKALRHNGSLLMISFLTERIQSYFQDRQEVRRPIFQDRRDRIVIQSYCQRNRFLSEMISHRMAFYNVCSVDVKVVLDYGTSCNSLEDNCTDFKHPVLLPKLFRVGNAIPLFRVQFMLVALLQLDTRVGP